MVISSDFRMGEHRDDDHEEDAPYFITASPGINLVVYPDYLIDLLDQILVIRPFNHLLYRYCHFLLDPVSSTNLRFFHSYDRTCTESPNDRNGNALPPTDSNGLDTT